VVNGKEGKKFVCKRGLQRGGSLSPLLFVLVVNVFRRILDIGKKRGLIEGLVIPILIL